ncbi:MAG: AI-2E family transporter [Roseinatronobacter sp.]
MALPVQDQVKYWTIASIGFGVVLWFLGDILLPFVTGAAIAYFLNPLVSRLTEHGLPRALAVSLIMSVMIGAVVLALLLVIPTVVGQIIGLTQTAPELLRQVQAFVTENFPAAAAFEETLKSSLVTMGEAIRDRGAVLAQGVLRSLTSVLGVVVFLLVAPVVAFYLLLDWPRLLQSVDDLLPRQHAPTLRLLGRDVDGAIAGFVRGQITVCLILAAYYATALGLAGLQFGIAIGVMAGLVSFIPYIGAILGGVLSVGLGLWQFWGDWGAIGLVVGIFAVGQVLEGNILVPRIVGSSVRLHPVWLLFAVSAFGALFGFTGMLIAVPVAAAIGVLVRFGIGQYMGSRLYGIPPGPEGKG